MTAQLFTFYHLTAKLFPNLKLATLCLHQCFNSEFEIPPCCIISFLMFQMYLFCNACKDAGNVQQFHSVFFFFFFNIQLKMYGDYLSSIWDFKLKD